MNVNVNKTLMAALLLGMASQAQAVDVTTNIGMMPTVPTTFNGTITHLELATPFTDTFNFSMPSSGLSALVADFEIQFGPGTPLFDINSLTAELYNGFNASGSWISNLAGSGTDTVNDSIGLVAGNNYSIRVLGTPTGTSGGMYAYAFTAAVPEAETYGMMLAGLGLVGFMARRRKQIEV